LLTDTICQNCEFDRLKLQESKKKCSSFVPHLKRSLNEASKLLQKYEQTSEGAFYRTASRKVSEVHESLQEIYKSAHEEDIFYVLFVLRKLSDKTLFLLSAISTLEPAVPVARKARVAQASFCDRGLY
jgi:hypothetical protein